MWGLRVSWDTEKYFQAMCFLSVSMIAAMGTRVLVNISKKSTQDESVNELTSNLQPKESSIDTKGTNKKHKYEMV